MYCCYRIGTCSTVTETYNRFERSGACVHSRTLQGKKRYPSDHRKLFWILLALRLRWIALPEAFGCVHRSRLNSCETFAIAQVIHNLVPRPSNDGLHHRYAERCNPSAAIRGSGNDTRLFVSPKPSHQTSYLSNPFSFLVIDGMQNIVYQASTVKRTCV